MTLIAGFEIEQMPLLLGDLLVSTQGDPQERHVELPTVGDSRGIIEPGWEISLWLRQKICLINDYTAVAWCGGYIKAGELLREMRTYVGQERLSRARRKDFFGSLVSNSYYEDVSLIGFTALSDRECDFFFHNNVKQKATDKFAQCLYQGSGSDDFDATEFGEPIHLDGPDWFRAVGAVQAVVAAFVTREIKARSLARDTTTNPLLALYGGGWEIALPGNARAYKPSDSTSIFWDIVEQADDTFTIRAPSLVVSRRYIGETLVERWMRGSAEAFEWTAPWTTQRCVAIPPMIGPAAVVDPLDPGSWHTFRSRLQIHIIFLTSKNGERFVVSRCSWRENESLESDIAFTETANDRSTFVKVTPQMIGNLRSLLGGLKPRMRAHETSNGPR